MQGRRAPCRTDLIWVWVAGGDLIGLLIAIPLYLMGMLVILLINRLVFWGGWTVDDGGRWTA